MLLLTMVMLTASASAVDFYIDTAKFETDVPPTIVNGRTLIPLRAIFEALGATVEWDQSTKTAIAKKDGVEMSIQIDNLTSYINGKEYILDVPAQLIHGRTMAPARFIAEALDCEVSWHSTSQTVAVAKELKGLDIYMSLSGDKSRYHFDDTCNKGSDYFNIELAWAMGLGLKPCKDCVLTSGYNIILPSENQTTNPAAENIMPEKPQKDGFDETTNTTYTTGNIALSIPSYYTDEKATDSSIFLYAETGETAVVLTLATSDYIYASVSSETVFDLPVRGFLSAFTNPVLLESENTQIAGLPARKILLSADFLHNGSTYKIYVAASFVANANNNSLTMITLSQVDNAAYNYFEDYNKIIQSATNKPQVGETIIDPTTNIRSAKPQKNGFDTKANKIYSVGDMTFSIPSYYGNEYKDNSMIYLYAETSSDATVMLMFQSQDLDASPPLAEIETFFSGVISGIIKSAENAKIIDIKDIFVSGLPGKMITYTSDVTIDGQVYHFDNMASLIITEKKFIGVVLSQEISSQYDYFSDYKKIIESATTIVKNKPSIPSEVETVKPKTSTTATNPTETSTQSRTVYITPTDKRYHYDSHYNGGSYSATTLEVARQRGLTPCQKCT